MRGRAALGVVLAIAVVAVALLDDRLETPIRVASAAAMAVAMLLVLVAERRAARREIDASLAAGRAAEERLHTERRHANDERAELVRRERAAAFLAQASRLLAASLDYATLTALARLAAGTIADWCVVDLVEPDGAFRRVAVAHADPWRADAARGLQLRYPPGPDGPATLRDVLAHGRPVVVPSFTPEEVERRARNADHLGLLRALGIASLMVVPLVARGRIVGAITLVRGDGEPYSAADLPAAEELAHRTAMAVEAAQLYASVQEARERFGQLVQGLDAIVWESDPVSLRFTFVSERAEALLGYPVTRWLDEPDFWPGILHPDDRARWLEQFAWCARQRADARFECRAIAADGRLVWLENVVRPVGGGTEPGTLRLHGFMLDVSERKRLEEEHHRLLASEQAARAEAEAAARRSKFLAETSQLLASSLDYEATLKAVTRLAVPAFADWCLAHLSDDGGGHRFQAAHTEVVSVVVAEALERVAQAPDLASLLPALGALYGGKPLLLPEVSPAWLETVRLVQELGPRSVIIVPLVARGRMLGTLTFVWSHSGRRYDAADLALAEDLARRAAVAVDNARLYREAEHANRTKDEFLATLSHELRTPLTAILGWVLGLRTGRLAPEQTARALDSIERNTRHQAQLIDDLLDVSRITAGKVTLDRRPVDLREVVETAAESVRPNAERKQLELALDAPPQELPVLGDAMRLQQVVLNLLANAVKFTPPGGRISVALAREGALARLAVSDTGDGIDPETLPRIFETFRQADGTSTRRHSGLGLGLAIVRHLVQLHGGEVVARSDGRGRGATFVITLPMLAVRLAGPPASGGEAERAPGAAIPRIDGIRVLVVDDHADARELVEAILAERGAQVLVAASAEQALEVLRSTYVDVLLSDIGMPDESGYDLIRQVRERERAHGGRLPAVALTAYAGEEDRERALAAGFQEHAAKPITPGDLVEVVARAARRT